MAVSSAAVKLDRYQHTNKIIRIRDKLEKNDTDYARIIEESLLWNV